MDPFALCYGFILMVPLKLKVWQDKIREWRCVKTSSVGPMDDVLDHRTARA